MRRLAVAVIASVLLTTGGILWNVTRTDDEVHARDYAICVRGNKLRRELRGFISEVLPPQSPSRKKFLTEIQLLKCR